MRLLKPIITTIMISTALAAYADNGPTILTIFEKTPNGDPFQITDGTQRQYAAYGDPNTANPCGALTLVQTESVPAGGTVTESQGNIEVSSSDLHARFDQYGGGQPLLCFKTVESIKSTVDNVVAAGDYLTGPIAISSDGNGNYIAANPSVWTVVYKSGK